MSSLSTPNTFSRFSGRMLLGLGVLSIILYFSVLDSGFLERDRKLTVYNPQVSEAGSPGRIWLEPTPFAADATAYRPVHAAVLRAQWKLRGESPSSFHFVNLMLFILLAGAFYGFCGLLGMRPWAVLIAALLLTLHPMASQSLHTISGQGALLALLAMMLAALAVMAMRRGALPPVWGSPALFLGMFVAGGSHELGLLLPLYLAGLFLLPIEVLEGPSEFRKKSRKAKPAVGDESPAQTGSRKLWLAIAAPVGLAFVFLIALRFATLGGLLPENLARPDGWTALELPGVLKPLALIGAYCFKLIWPFQPSILFHPSYGGFPLPPLPAAAFALAPFAVLAFGLMKQRRLALAALWVLLPLLAASHLIPQSEFFSEEYLLFALPGFALAAGVFAGGFMGAAVKFPPAALKAKIALAVLLIYGLAAGAVTLQRGFEWEDSLRLMRAEATQHPEDPYPYIMMIREALALDDRSAIPGWIEAARPLAQGDALRQLILHEAAFLIDEQRFDAFDTLVRTQVAAESPDPLALLKLGEYANAAERYAVSQEVWTALLARDKDSFTALSELSATESNRGNHDRAIELGNRMVAAARSEREKTTAMARYGRILFNAGKQTEAFNQMATVLDRDRSQYLAYVTMAEILWANGKHAEAVAAINACLENTRVESYTDVARIYSGVLVAQDKLPAAVQWLNDRVKQSPRDVKLRIFVGRFFEHHRMYQDAWDTLYPIRDIDSPLRADVVLGLGLVAANGFKDYDRAIQLAQLARQIKPGNQAATDLIRQSTKLRNEQKLEELEKNNDQNNNPS